MTIGIIGAGNIGGAIAATLARAKVPATIANSRGPLSLRPLITRLGGSIVAGTPAEAAAADVVFLAVPWVKLADAVKNFGPWDGHIVVDANNPIGSPFRVIDLGGRSSSEVVAELLPGARVVKAFNHLPAALLSADPRREGGQRALFLAGDDAKAKAEVARLMTKLGFLAVDLGALAVGGRLFEAPGGSLAALNLVKFDT